MTCIIAVRTREGIVLGCDSCTTSASHRYTLNTENLKIIQKSVKIVDMEHHEHYYDYLWMGYAGKTLIGNIIKYNLNLSDFYNVEDEQGFVFEAVTNLVNELKLHNETFNQLIIVFKNKVYMAWANGTVTEHFSNYEAIGSGKDIALGVLFAYLRRNELPSLSEARSVIHEAFRACSFHLNDVSEPFYTVDTNAGITIQL